MGVSSSSQPSSGGPSGPKLDRNYLAAVRTLFAMQRTGSVVAGGGVLVTDLLIRGWPRWVVGAISSAFVVLGCWMMGAALKKGRQLRALAEREGGEFLFGHRQFAIMTVSLQGLIGLVLILYLLGH